MEKKIGSVIKINDSDIKLKIGTIDKKHPSVIFIEGGCYVTPINEKSTYKNDFNEITEAVKEYLEDKLNGNADFDCEFLFFTDIADEWIRFGKKSFLCFKLYLKSGSNLLKRGKNFTEIINSLLKERKYNIDFIKNVIYSYGYEISKRK